LEVRGPSGKVYLVSETVPIAALAGEARLMPGYFDPNRVLDFSIPYNGGETTAGMNRLALLIAAELRKEAQAVENVALAGVIRANQNIEGPQIQRHIPQTLVIANVYLV
jgi:hypothetical protein